MTSLVTDQGIIHYETYGRGRPVILLHGWLESWAVWRQTIEELGKEFRTYALDFYGFGESDSISGNTFTVDHYVEMVNQFIDRLGIVKAPLIGHSMGGTVSLSMAMRYPEKIVKVAVIGSPIVGSSLNIFLKLSGLPQIAALLFRFPFMLRFFSIVGSYQSTLKQPRQFYRLITNESQLSMYSFFQSIGTLRRTDLRPHLNQIRRPTLGIYGKWDFIVHPNQAKVLKEGVKHAEISLYNRSSHLPMLDEPERFISEIRNFLITKHT